MSGNSDCTDPLENLFLVYAVNECVPVGLTVHYVLYLTLDIKGDNSLNCSYSGYV